MMTLKHVNMLKSLIGFVLMFIKILKIVIKKNYYYLNLFVDQKLQMLMKLNNMIYNMKPYTNENY
jgi:hypothetical protein